jgi:hypothetical protein
MSNERALRRMAERQARLATVPRTPILNRRGAARMIGIANRTLDRWNKAEYGPARSSKRTYVKADVEEWVAKRRSRRKPRSSKSSTGDDEIALPENQATGCTKNGHFAETRRRAMNDES